MSTPFATPAKLYILCSAYPSFPTGFHNLILKKRTRTYLFFFPLFHQHSLFLCFHSPVLISFQPVIILLDQSCQIPFFVSCTFFYFSRLFKFAPSWLPAYLSALPLSGMVSQSRGERSEEKRLAKIKGPRPLPWAELLANAIYLPFASPCVSLMDHRSPGRRIRATRRLDTMTSQTVQKKRHL